MPWYFPWSDYIKKRACRYLLQHYLGQFLKEKLSLDQLSVDIYNGTGTIRDVALDVAAINEVLESSKLPVQLVDGFIGKIDINIPWGSLISDNTNLEIRNLEITLQPSPHDDGTGHVMLDSMLSSFSSMTTSMQLAEECLKPETEAADTPQNYEGLEVFAQTIEAVLSKVKISLVDTIIRLEHIPRDADRGAALELRIDRINYFDDLADEKAKGAEGGTEARQGPAAIVHKNLHLMGVNLFCDEFSAASRTRSPDNTTMTDDYGTSPPLPDAFQGLVISDQPGKLTTDAGKAQESLPVKIAVLMGTQKVKVKLKQEEHLAVPKAEVDLQIGVLNVHLSPRQVHLLIEVAEGLTTPGASEDRSRRKTVHNKPMGQAEFSLVESELQRELYNKRATLHPGGGLLHDNKSHTSHQGIDDEGEDIFLSLDGARVGPGSMDTSYSSHTTTKSNTTTGSLLGARVTYDKGPESHSAKLPSARSTQPKPRKDSTSRFVDDPGAEVTKYRVKVSFLSAMILHEDPPSTPENGIDQGVSSQQKLRDMANKYFGRVLGINIAGTGVQLPTLRAEFSKACPFDHLSFLARPLNLELSEKFCNQVYSLTGDLTLGAAELVEALYGKTSVTHELLSMQYSSADSVPPEYCELLVLEESEESNASASRDLYSSVHAAATPSVRVNISSTTDKRMGARGQRGSKTEIHTELMKPCQCELDMTIVDRIHSLLNRLPLGAQQGPTQPQAAPCAQSMFQQAMAETPTHLNKKTEFKVTSHKCTVTLRFPRVDMSAGSAPWWKRSLHNELLILELSDLEFKTVTWPQQTSDTFEFTCREGHGLFQVSADKDPISFIHIGTADRPGELNERDMDGFDWPRFVLKLFPEPSSTLLDTGTLDYDEGSHEDEQHACSEFNKRHSTPFSARTSLYDDREMVLPGDRQEMLDYEEKAQSHTRLSMELSIPHVNAFIPDKPFLELLYNRLLNDMVLWEPLAPKPLEQATTLNIHMPQYDLSIHAATPDSFQACKSDLHNDSDSELDESMPYLSVGEQKRRARKRQARDLSARQQSKLCFQLSIGHGQLTAHAPLLGEDQMVSERDSGLFVLRVSDATVFSEVDHNGDPELMYTCVHSNTAQLHHQGCVPVPATLPVIGRGSDQIPPELDRTLYLSSPGTCTKLAQGLVGRGADSNTNDMLSVAVKVKLDLTKNIKECQVAVGVRATTLEHRVTPSGQDWLSQLMDLFDLVDYEIQGYTPPKVITELHAHVWSSAIDYRPLYLPYRAMLTFECFTVSSNVLTDSHTSLLRFLLEDTALYLSDKRDEEEINLRKNYVCVADMGMFELALKTSDGKDPKYPTKMDLKVSNNILHVRTCADSMRAMSQLINYLASCGDLQSEEEMTEPVQPREVPERKETVLPEEVAESMHDLIGDAMRESSSESQASSTEDIAEPTFGDKGAQLFFHPAELTSPATTKPDADDDYSDDFDSELETSGPLGLSGSVPPPQRMRGESGLSESLLSGASVSFSVKDDSASVSLSMTQSQDIDSPEMEDYAGAAEGRAGDEEFCIIDDPGLGYGVRNGVPLVKKLTDRKIEITDNHFAIALGRADVLKPPEHFPAPEKRYTVREVSVVWHLYGGRDFETSPTSQTSTKTQRALQNQRKVCSGHMSKLSWQALGGAGRDIDVLMELQLSKIRVQIEEYPSHTEQAARQVLLINDIEIRDRMASSKINKFLYQYSSDAMPKQSHTSMLEIKALHLRPDPKLSSQECSLKVSIQPLRLNIDQDALNFLRLFVMEVCDTEEDLGAGAGSTDSADATQPIMQVAGVGEDEMCDPASFVPQLDELSEQEDAVLAANPATQPQEEADTKPVFVKCFVFSPDVPIRLDYHGKRVDMGQGTVANLLVGLTQLNCSELRLKRLHHKKGLLGADKVARFARDEWMQDIMKNQIPSILGGVGPMHSLVQIVHGVRDLFWLPVEQYRKDGRIVRGLQRGTHSFMTCTAMSTLELTNRLVHTVQYVAEVGYDMVTPTRNQRVPPRYRIRQPVDFREGLVNAYTVITEGVKGTATDIAKSALEGHDYKGLPGAVGGVLKQVPGAIIQPVILATGATSNILDGVKNQMQPDRKREDEDKWKPEDSGL